MTPASRSGTTRRHVVRSVVVLCLAALAVLHPVSPASAHATLLRSDPPDGAVLRSSPDAVTFTFDETVRLTSSSVQVFDARGTVVPATVTGRDQVVSAALPARLPRGTYVVTWRVVSADSHPVAGSITFSVGAPSATVLPPQAPADASLTRALSITAGLDYVSLFAAGGLVLFSIWVLEGVRVRRTVADRLALTRWTAALIAVFAAANAVPLQGADDLGVGLHGVGDSSTLDLSLVGSDVVVLAAQATGLGIGLLVMDRRRWLSTVAVAVAVASPAWVGHSRSAAPGWIVLPADVTHLLAGGVWLGGLLGLGMVLGTLRGREGDAATALTRFSTVAACSFGAVILTGSVAAWRILGSWSALVHTGYGRLLLVKIAVVALAALVAAFNRWRLLPGVVGGVGHRERSTAALRVRTAVWCEAALLVVVLGLTGWLVNLSPNEQPAARTPVASTVATTQVGAHRVLAEVSPGAVGPNTVTVRVQDESGSPVEGYAAPRVTMSSGDLDLGAVRLHRAARGAYAAAVVLPRAGTWTVRISLRFSRFDNPVAELPVLVR